MLTSMDLLNELLLLLVVEVHVPLGQPRLPRPVLYHHKPDHPAPHPSAKKKTDTWIKLPVVKRRESCEVS